MTKPLAGQEFDLMYFTHFYTVSYKKEIVILDSVSSSASLWN